MKARKSFLIAASCLFLGFVAVVEADAGANLVPTMISGPAEAFMNQTISVTYRVKNDGNETSDAYEVRLYLSKNRNINPEADYFLRKVSIAGGLAPGESIARTVKVIVPEYYLHRSSKRYYFGAMVGKNEMASREKVSIARYNDNGDGTVMDHKTGLMWQQDDNGTVRYWGEAKKYCERLVLAGHDDWIMPTIEALATIVDYSEFLPAIDPVFGVYGQNSRCWSITSCHKVSAWVANFDSGSVFCTDKNEYKSFVRCVRYAK